MARALVVSMASPTRTATAEVPERYCDHPDLGEPEEQEKEGAGEVRNAAEVYREHRQMDGEGREINHHPPWFFEFLGMDPR